MATKYITQAGAGTNSGDDYDNAYAAGAITWGAGNTYYLCDTITTSITLGASGTAGNEVVVRGDDATHPGTIDASGNTSGISTGGREYVRLTALTVANATAQGILVPQGAAARTNIEVDNCVISACGSRGIYVNANGQALNNVSIHDNRVSTCGASGDADTGGIYAKVSAGVTCAGLKIYGNTCTHVGTTAAGRYGIGVYPATGAPGGTWTGAHIYNNTCYGWAYAGIDCTNDVVGPNIYGNTVYNNVLTGIHCGGNNATNRVTYAAVHSNVAYGTMFNGTTNVDASGIYFDDYTEECKAWANLSYDNEESGFKLNDCVSCIVEGNITHSNGNHALHLSGTASGDRIRFNTFDNRGAAGEAVKVGVDVGSGAAAKDILTSNIIVAGTATAPGNICIKVYTTGLCDSVGNVLYGETTYSGTVGDKTGDTTVDPALNSAYAPGNSSLKGTATWIAGVRAYDDLALPLRPDIGAVQDRNAAGRKLGVGGGAL